MNFDDPWVGTETPGGHLENFFLRSKTRNSSVQRPKTRKNQLIQNKTILNITKMKIARNHVVGFGRKSMEKLPTSLPELFRPTRDQNNRQTNGKTRFLLPKKIRKKSGGSPIGGPL